LQASERGSGGRKSERWAVAGSGLYHSRPLCALALAFIAGLAFEQLDPFVLPEKGVLFSLFVLLALLITLLFRPVRRALTLRFPWPLLFFACLGFLAGETARPALPSPASLEPFFDRPGSLFLAEISGPPDYYPDKIQIPLRVQKAFWDEKSVPVEGGVLFSLYTDNMPPGKWRLGDRLLARLTLKRFHNFNNPGGYDYVRNQAERGLHARAHSSNDHFLLKLASPQPGEVAPLGFLLSVRNRLDGFRQGALFWLRKNLEPDAASLYAALLLGYRHLLSAELKEHLNRAGVTHLLAISGLHLGMISLAAFWVLSRLARWLCPSFLQKTSDRHIALWGALAASIAYALISGLALPTWRAAIMLLFISTALLCYRPPDAPSLLSAAALIILVISPSSLKRVSFQLSFGAMIGIFAIYPHLKHLLPSRPEVGSRTALLAYGIFSPFANAFVLSLAANATVLPLLIFHFHGVSVAGLLANTLLVPLVGLLVLPAGLISLAVYAVGGPLALPILKLGAGLLECCRYAIVQFSSLSWAFFWVGALPFHWLAGYFTGLYLLLRPRPIRVKALSLATLSAVLLSALVVKHTLTAHTHPAALQATFIDVGQGSSTLLQFPSGETMLVDGGGFFDDSFDVGRNVVAPFLWYMGIRKLDHVMLSHDHPDHRNGLRFILSYFSVGSYWHSGISEKKSPHSNDLAMIAARHGIPVKQLPEVLGTHMIGGCRVEILHPSPSYLEKSYKGDDLNNVSLVTQVDYGNTRLILPGDIDQSVERLLFAHYHFPGQVLLVSPHHGSGRSNSSFLLDRINPEAMVFSCGFDNWFGFPDPRVLHACRERGIPIYRTDLCGAIQALSDGKRWEIR